MEVIVELPVMTCSATLPDIDMDHSMAREKFYGHPCHDTIELTAGQAGLGPTGSGSFNRLPVYPPSENSWARLESS